MCASEQRVSYTIRASIWSRFQLFNVVICGFENDKRGSIIKSNLELLLFPEGSFIEDLLVYMRHAEQLLAWSWLELLFILTTRFNES